MIFLFYHRKPKRNTYFTDFISQSHKDSVIKKGQPPHNLREIGY